MIDKQGDGAYRAATAQRVDAGFGQAQNDAYYHGDQGYDVPRGQAAGRGAGGYGQPASQPSAQGHDRYDSGDYEFAGDHGQDGYASNGYGPDGYDQTAYDQDPYGQPAVDAAAHHGYQTDPGAAPQGAPRAPGARLGAAVNWVGGAMSLVLVGGLAVWGYQLAMRDVTGVPVVRALEGPVRVAPEQPGGSQADHQGLSVNEVQAEGGAGGPAMQVALAPRAPGLSDEDLPRAVLAEENAENHGAETGEAGDGTDDPDLTVPGAAGTETAEGEMLAEEGTETAEAATLSDTPEDALATDAAVAEALAAGPAIGAEPGPDASAADRLAGLPYSPRPARRPQDLSRPAPQAVQDTAAPAEVTLASAQGNARLEVDPASLPKGTRLVQLGAYESDDVARQQWQKINARFEEYFEGKRRVVQRAISGGKTFYRLRAEGFADLGDARRFCSALVADGADCIPVELR